MSAISIVSKTLIEHGEYPKELATALQKKYPHLPSAEDIISDPDLVHFFKKKRSPVKKKEKKAKKKNVSSPKKKKVSEKSPANMSIEELIELLNKKEKEEAEKKNTIDEEEKEGSEGGLGAGVGFEEAPPLLTRPSSSDSNKTEPCSQSEEEEETFILKNINDVEYQINTEDNTVIRIEGYEIVGEWDHEREEIIFIKE